MSAGPEYSVFLFDGHSELCLKSGQSCSSQILLVPPLFDEMNRLRHILIDVMRDLATRGIGSILPDLPGTNESTQPQDHATLELWARALANYAEQAENITHVASFRGGTLIDHKIGLPHWRFSPVKGSNLLRTMMRTRIASDKESGISTSMADLSQMAQSNTINLAGNLLGPEMFNQLNAAVPTDLADTRIVRLQSENKEADGNLAGGPFWLRAEPTADTQLTSAITKDLADWVAE
ncbi:hypothetical protein MNBD_ALPHA04-1256 [hydrothermal vent metagenome]|uniref:Uncharacterized protein n=1 Tax=hydrothermal vent metagenome TaxID=652676 RepID=A0A3B0T2M2_9ZZZZ